MKRWFFFYATIIFWCHLHNLRQRPQKRISCDTWKHKNSYDIKPQNIFSQWDVLHSPCGSIKLKRRENPLHRGRWISAFTAGGGRHTYSVTTNVICWNLKATCLVFNSMLVCKGESIFHFLDLTGMVRGRFCYSTPSIKGIFTPKKSKFCHHLLALTSLQTFVLQ